MDIASLRTFLAAAECGSFSGAAGRVNASASSVTERIKQLEHRLGARLFDRDKRGCRLTSAGRRFVGPARQAVRAMELARHEVALPRRFTQSMAFGGQYVLWGPALLAWMRAVRESHPHIAWRLVSGASVRLNRDLAEGHLDMAVLYDPVFRRDIGTEPLFVDQLALVTAGDPARWREDFVPIEWGRDIGTEIASRLGLSPRTGMMLDLGARSAEWLVNEGMAGFMPLRSVAKLLDNGRLTRVSDVPSFDFPAYVCWRRDLNPALAAELILSLKSAALQHEHRQ